MAFWKPGTARPGSTLDRATESEPSFDAGAASAAASANLSISSQRARLPIVKQRERLLHMVERHPVTIVVGQTGSGKTTQIPQYLMEAGWASSSSGMQIAVTQPRRISAISVASRVSSEVGCVLGDEVGYTIRFEDLSHPTRTKIKYMTDGVLFRECLRDPLLNKYSVIMVDEAHERGAYTDLLVALLKKIRRKRPTLRLIISSATIDAQAFVEFFTEDERAPVPFDKSRPPPAAEATIVSLEGRVHPVDLAYLETPCEDYVKAAVDAAFDIHLKEPQGDILVFLTGREEIDVCLQELADRLLDLPSGSPKLLLLPLHAGLSSEEQTSIFEPTPRGSRKCIVATNIAEASVTIDGIKFVVDCGLVKLRMFNPKTGMDALRVVPESLASATQRAGRAGRTSPGKCFRLFPESTLSSLLPSTSPELSRSDISLQALQLKAMGIDNLAKFEFLPPVPPAQMMVRALEFLASLGAIDEWGRLTKPLGESMAEMPVDPMLAKVILDSQTYRCGIEILSIAAMTSVSTPFIIPDEGKSRAGAEGELERRKFTAEEGDHLTLLNVYNAFTNPRVGKQSSKWCSQHKLNFKALSRAVSIRGQLEKYTRRFNVKLESCEGDSQRLRRCLTSGYFKNAAKIMADGTYRSVRENATLHVHPSSVMFNRNPSTKWVIYHEVIETSKRFMRDITVIDSDWLTELAPHFYSWQGDSTTRP